MRMLYQCLALMNLLLSVAPPSSSFMTLAVSKPQCDVNSDRLSSEEDHLREDYYYEALALSRHLEFDEETTKPKKATEAPKKRKQRSKYREKKTMVPET